MKRLSLCVSLLILTVFSLFGQQSPPTVKDATAFVDSAEQELLGLWIKAQRNSWVQSNFITDDTEILNADAQQAMTAVTVDLANRAKRFKELQLPYDIQRKLNLIKLSLTLPAPSDNAEQTEISRISASLEGDYGKGKFTTPDGKSYNLNDASRIMASSRNADTLTMMWKGWHGTGAQMRKRYERLTELCNKGAREMGYADLGADWRSNYDMAPDAFAKEVDRIWEQVKPFYEALHAYVRTQLVKKYGDSVVPKNGPIPAQLLGNMWAQEWGNIYPLVAPPASDPGYDLTEILKERNSNPVDMVHHGENFFISLGFEPLPATFWERSLLSKPADRDVVCHASAWSIDFKNDLRIKMCIESTEEDFRTIHHELGHNFYQRAYNQLSPLYQSSANDGFHEALGDLIALSVTPEYLKQIDFIKNVPDTKSDLGLLMRMALEKIAFLPFGIVVDQWRWKVFSGEIQPKDYNKAWWELRQKYQGIKPPVERGQEEFDPGAKYHVAASVPYTRYFLAFIYQFQFHRALARTIDFKGPIHRASIYNNKAAGDKLKKMMAMGQSRPWPEALEALTGEKQLDATAIMDYFAPLKKWLDEQNKGHKVGW